MATITIGGLGGMLVWIFVHGFPAETPHPRLNQPFDFRALVIGQAKMFAIATAFLGSAAGIFHLFLTCLHANPPPAFAAADAARGRTQTHCYVTARNEKQCRR